MRRATAVGIMTAVLLVALHASAATLLFLDSDPGDYLGGGQSQLFTSPAGAFVMGTTYGNGVTFHVNTPGYASWWDVSFFPPDGQTLAPGTYPDAGQTPYDVHPALYVSGDGRGCSGSGRFVVHEVRFAANGSVLAFAADFEEHCDGGTPALRGAVRFGSGNAACAAAADGAPCDDLNPCTTTSACQGNLCLGTDPLSSGCTTTDDCHAAGLCSPLTGACTSPEQPDGTTCTADACTSDPTCRAGICTGTPAACDDGNACTADRCDPAHGCVAEALSGCWNIAGRGVLTEWATGSGNGKTATCTLRCETAASGALVLGADDTYRSPTTSLGICPSGLPFDVPDEVGTVVHRRRRLVLKIGNRAEIVSALRRCTGRRFALKRYGTTVQLDADGTHLSGTNRLQIVIPGTYATHAGVVVHFKGALGGTPAPLEPPSRQLPVCSPDLRPVCVVR